jgi:sterol desaturase/sphingolipid hydroxylase (fatty acid hydroxylase superfamily)
MRRALPWLVLPVIVASAMGGLAFALGVGIPIPLALAAGGALFGGAVLVLERYLPHAREWQRPRGDVVTDALHLVVTGVLVGSLPQLVLDGLGLSLWPIGLPLAVQVALGLLGKDLFVYGAHRVLHRFLWRVHAIHHSAPRLYWLNAWRAHPLEGLLTATFAVVPLALLGAPPVVALYVWAFTAVFGLVQHSNIELRGGPLNWVFATAELHRWHHSRDPKEADRNFGQIFILWDALFGTRYLPKRGSPPVGVGIAIADFPSGYVGQLVAPFQRGASSASSTR